MDLLTSVSICGGNVDGLERPSQVAIFVWGEKSCNELRPCF